MSPTGAAQQALIDRIGASGGLADLIATTPGVGRGRVDIPVEPTAFGTPAMRPDQVPTAEELRVAVGVLVELLVPTEGLDTPPRSSAALDHRERLPWPWVRRFSVAGSPLAAQNVRRALLADGRIEGPGGRRRDDVVIVLPFVTMMTEQWTARVLAGSRMRWRRLWDIAALNDRIPPRLTAHEGTIYAAPTAAEAGAAAGRGCGVRVPPVEPHDLLGIDLIRRMNAFLELRHGGDGRDRIVLEVLPALLANDRPMTSVAVPVIHQTWAEGAARRLAGGYPVDGPGAGTAGNVVLLTPQAPGSVIPSAAVLELASTVIGRAWERKAG